jgi:hypothetical protein
VPDPEIWTLTSKRGWPKIDYDKTIWIPCPSAFNEQMSREEWAHGFATLWWEASGFQLGKRELKRRIEGLEKALLVLQEGIYETQPCHTAVIYLPNVDVAPIPVMVAAWEAVGDADSQLRMLVHADEPEAVEPPLVEPFTADRLGTGLKSEYLQRSKLGPDLTGVVNYAWRLADLETDVRVFAATPDLGRLQAAMPDIDQLTNTISIEPR